LPAISGRVDRVPAFRNDGLPVGDIRPVDCTATIFLFGASTIGQEIQRAVTTPSGS